MVRHKACSVSRCPLAALSFLRRVMPTTTRRFKDCRMRKGSVIVLTFVLWWGLHAYWPAQMDSVFVVYGQTGASPGANGTITLNTIAPSYAAAGSPVVTITLTGSGFENGAVAYADNDALTTQYVSP